MHMKTKKVTIWLLALLIIVFGIEACKAPAPNKMKCLTHKNVAYVALQRCIKVYNNYNL